MEPIRVAAVSYLNTLPLIEGLGKLEGLSLTLTAPNELIGLLERDEADLALASTIDYLISPSDLAIAPAGMIGCDGPTLTVRLFSTVPIEQVRTVAADVDSHTSWALLRVLMKSRHGVEIELRSYDADTTAEPPESLVGVNAPAQALLLIGDKVVTSSLAAIRFPHQLDLGEAWHALTGLPFVYAAWMCPADRAAEPSMLAAIEQLDRQRRRNMMRLDWIVDQRAALRGWPTELAREYLRDRLRYELDARSLAGLEAFYERCAAMGIAKARAIRMVTVSSAHAGTPAEA